MLVGVTRMKTETLPGDIYLNVSTNQIDGALASAFLLLLLAAFSSLEDYAPQARKLGYLYQEYCLFPHMTARENIAYGLIKEINSQHACTIVFVTHDFYEAQNLADRTGIYRCTIRL